MRLVPETYACTGKIIIKFEHFGADEATLELGVDDSCCARCFGAVTDGTALDLVFPSG